MKYNLVFEGGGAKGLVFVGAIEALEARGVSGYGRLIGTSAGAITATLLAVGYDYTELKAATTEKVNGKPIFTTFMDTPTHFSQETIDNSFSYNVLTHFERWFIPKRLRKWLTESIINDLMKIAQYREVFSFVEQGGLYAGDAFVNWFAKKLKAKDGRFGTITLGEFYEQTGHHLTVVTSNTSKSEMLILNHITAPDCPLVWAVRMSMSIPFVWQEVVWLEEWGSYRGGNITGDIMVDGGLLSNFPLRLLTSTDPDVVEMMGDEGGIDTAILGLLIDTDQVVPGTETLPTPTKNSGEGELILDIAHNRVVERVERLIDTVTEAYDNEVIHEYANLVCHLPAKGYGTTEFDMSDKRMELLIAGGRQAMADYFKKQS